MVDDNMKKNVLIYTERWCSGGIESLLANLIKYLDKSKFNVEILVSQKETDIYNSILNGVSIEEILEKKCSNPFVRIFNTIIRFKKVIRNKKIDVIHINVYNGVGMVYAYMARKMGIKNIIVHAHNSGIDDDKFKIKAILHSICKKLFSKYADNYIACSKEAANFCFKIPKNKNLTIINNGIDTERFKYNPEIREQYRKEFDVEKNLVIGNVGRFVEQKNHEFLLEVFWNIKKIKPEAKLLLVGSGTLEEIIKSKIKTLNIAKDVIILKERNDIQNILQALDILCLPSKYEGLGIVAIEAQACGTKCVVSDGVPENALITPNIISISLKEDAKTWTKKIIEFLDIESEKDMTKYIKTSGYDINENTKQIEKIYGQEKEKEQL